MGKILAALGVLVVIVVLGMTVPRFFTNRPPSSLNPEETIFARSALYQARMFIGGSSEPAINTGFTVERIEPIPSDGPACTIINPDDPGYDGPNPLRIAHRYNAVLRGHTIFGIPYMRMMIFCDESAQAER